MTEATTLLNLPYIMPSQAQKHVTHNEALRMLDALVHLCVKGRGVDEPPHDPVEGERHVVGAAPSGAFAGQAGRIAAFQDGAWAFHQPQEGWVIRDAAEGVLLVFDGAAWTPAFDRQNQPLVGVNTEADETNRLAVRADATLLTHAGAGHQLKINKATAGDTASLLFQTGWSGRAEMGLAGNDDFSIKVSPDGAAWHTALRADRATGQVAATGLEVTAGAAGESGLKFGNLTAASAAAASNNKVLGLDTDGRVVQRAASFPAYTMTGANSETTILRDYNAQVAKGSGLYVSDNAGAIVNNPSGAWSSMAITGWIGSMHFAQLVLTSKAMWFRSGLRSAAASVPWNGISQFSGLPHGYVPYQVESVTAGEFYQTASLLYQGEGRMGLGTAAPHASALLDLTSSTRGLLPPRMTATQRDAIPSPAEGLMIYNLTAHEPQFWNGLAWVGMG